MIKHCTFQADNSDNHVFTVVLTLSRREPYAAVGLLSLTSKREFKVHESSSEQNFWHLVHLRDAQLDFDQLKGSKKKRICSIEKWLILSSTKERRHSRHIL